MVMASCERSRPQPGSTIPDAGLPEAADEPTEHEWLRLLMAGGAFDDLADPREDIYSIEDGKPFVGL